MIALLTGCFAEAGSIETSGSTIDGADSTGTSSTTDDTAATTSDAPTTTSPDSSGSSEGTSTTGTVESFALVFEGGMASTPPTPIVNFDDSEFTIEMWVRAPDGFQGVLFDTTIAKAGVGNGLYVAVGEEYLGTTAVAFQNLGVDPGLAPILFGPESTELDDWSHLAITHETDGTHRMWIDGVLVDSEVSATPIDNVDVAEIFIGSRESTPFPPLTGVLVDELRISSGVLYEQDFAPTRPLGVEASVLLHWTFDEGSGTTAVDGVVGLPLTFDTAVGWAPG